MVEEPFSGVHEVGVRLPSRAEVEVGIVLKWRRRGDIWEGLVARETADGTLLTEWLPALVFTPLDKTAS
ncbi:hypothetical protein [Nocardioides silvaticus]|uniref:hypothetical protein n=1 Tax=Nocardioides silvaticus TaxID=2201891 RepID=UPI0011B21C18|nr:hypothetical protein [Nocardioides silvaticus]